MDIQLHLPAFLFRYLSAEYGPGPYDLEQYRALRIAFLHWGFYADALPPLVETPESVYLIVLKLPESESLHTMAKLAVNHPPNFFVAEFYNAVINYTEGYMAQGNTNRKSALAHFLARYNISEDVYPLETAYRNMHRWLKKKNQCRKLQISVS